MSVQDAKYQQVIDWVKENIDSGALKAGEKLESEMELAERFGLSRQTIRHATGELVAQGLLTRVRGSGTYVGSLPGSPAAGRPVATPSSAASLVLPAGTGHPVHKASTMNIAVVSTFYESYIFPQTLKGIEHVLAKNGYVMQVYFTDNRLHRERDILNSILEKDLVDGVIVEPAKSALPNPNLEYYRRLQERGIPILFFNAAYPSVSAPCVRIDDTRIARKATSLLIEAGHRRIAGIFKSDDGQGPLRYAGYLEAMEAGGCHTYQEQIVWIDTPETVRLADIGDYLFRRIEGCTAVMCYNDQVAFQVIDLALARGIRVPEELSVVGIDDAYLAPVCRVPLTSFPHPKEELGRKTAENLVKMIENPGFDGGYLFDSEPILRSSVANIS